MHTVRWFVSVVLLVIFLMPSPRILDPHRQHHRDPARRQKTMHRAEREKQREEAARLEQTRVERARQEEARRAIPIVEADDQQPATADQDHSYDAAVAVQDLDEGNLQPCQAAADPQDDDSGMKRGRRPAKVKTLFWSLQDPPRIRPAGDFLAMLRVYFKQQHASPWTATDVLPHYGSGPCHSIPRPREGTVIADDPCLSVVA